MERLSNERFIPPSAFRLYHQILHEPTDIHWHEFFELAYILAGEGFHLLNGTVFPLTRGSLFLLTPADFHALGPTQGAKVELINVIFSEAMIEEEVGQLLFQGLNDCHFLFTDNQALSVEAEFLRLESEVMELRTGYKRVIHSTLQRLLIDVARSTPSADCPNNKLLAPHHKLQKAFTYLHHHFREPITLQNVADQVAMSRSHFSFSFRSATGVTYQRYLQCLRLRFAKALLTASSLPVTDICFASGFQTLSHFERVFRTEYGQSPTAWRQEQRSQPAGNVMVV